MKTKFPANMLLKALGITNKKISYCLKTNSLQQKTLNNTSNCLIEISELLFEKEKNIVGLKNIG